MLGPTGKVAAPLALRGGGEKEERVLRIGRRVLFLFWQNDKSWRDVRRAERDWNGGRGRRGETHWASLQAASPSTEQHKPCLMRLLVLDESNVSYAAPAKTHVRWVPRSTEERQMCLEAETVPPHLCIPRAPLPPTSCIPKTGGQAVRIPLHVRSFFPRSPSPTRRPPPTAKTASRRGEKCTKQNFGQAHPDSSMS